MMWVYRQRVADPNRVGYSRVSAIAVGALVVAASACSTTASDDGEFTYLAIVPDAADGETRSAGTLALTELVDGITEGRVTIDTEFDPSQHCADADGCLAALQAGDIDIYRATADELVVLFPELQVLDLPYLIESSEVAELVFSGAFFARMRDAILERTDLRLMAVSNVDGWRHIANNVHEVRTPDDLDGVTLATLDVPVHVETTRALGATPLTGPPADAASAAVTSQGSRTGVLSLLANDAESRPAHLTLDRHNYVVALWLMNERAYRQMPLDLQQIVQLGFDELKRLTLGFPDAREAEALAAFESAGGQVYVPTDDERRAFVMAGGRVSTWFMDAYGYEWLVWLEGAIAEAERELATAAAPGL